MDEQHTTVGILLFAAAVLALGYRYLRAPKPARFRPWGWAGLAIILVAEVLLFRGQTWVTVFFTPIAWTGYLLLVDALVGSLRGHSRLGSTPREFFWLAFWSVPLWLIFEGYNLRLANWAYVGLPENWLVRGFGYAWSFATIWPAIFETADFLEALGLVPTGAKARKPWSRAARLAMFLVGLALVTVPALVPFRLGQYLFGAVWVGFIPLLDPVNYHWGRRSLLGDWERGQSAALVSFPVGGLVCGIFWEFWNHWSRAKWLYIFPIFQDWKIFEMPLPGYLGFPPFALECLVMYEFIHPTRTTAKA